MTTAVPIASRAFQCRAGPKAEVSVRITHLSSCVMQADKFPYGAWAHIHASTPDMCAEWIRRHDDMFAAHPVFRL